MQRKMQPLCRPCVAAELLLEAKGDTFREGRPCSDANGATAAGEDREEHEEDEDDDELMIDEQAGPTVPQREGGSL